MLTREKIERSPEYWIMKTGLGLLDLLVKEGGSVNADEIASRTGLDKKTVKEILSVEYNATLSEFIKLLISLGYRPIIQCQKLD